MDHPLINFHRRSAIYTEHNHRPNLPIYIFMDRILLPHTGCQLSCRLFYFTMLHQHLLQDSEMNWLYGTFYS